MFQEQWLNPRRKRFWAIVAILLYTLLGFFAVPAVVKNSIISLVEEELSRTARIEKVEFNPYVLSLSVQGFEMDDSDDVRLASFDEFFVNFQLSSLFRWAWTFREIRLAGSYFFFERFEPDDSRLGRLVSDLASVNPEDGTEEKNPNGLPRLLVYDLKLSDGRAVLKDNVPATPVSLQLGPIDISVQELNTLPDRYGRQSVNIVLPDEASLHWEGSLALAPLDSEGELVLINSHLDNTIAYLEAILPLESIKARLSSRFNYRVHMQADGGLSAQIDDLEIELDELAISGLNPTTDFLAFSKLSLHGGKLHYPEQTLQFSSVRIDDPRLTAWLDENAVLSLEQLIQTEPGASDTQEPDSPAWQLGIDELTVEGGNMDLTDHSVSPAVEVGIRDFQFTLADISNQDGGSFPLNLSANIKDGGSFGLNGQLALFPELNLAINLQTQAIPLTIAEPYVQRHAHILIEGGTLDSNMEIAVPASLALSVGGNVQVNDLLIKDTIENKRLLGWKGLDIDRFDLDLAAGSVQLSQMLFDQPFARVIIYEDLGTNLSELVVEAQSPEESTEDDPMSMTIAYIRVDDGSMDFSDLSLPLPFATHITNMDGTISTIASNSTEPAAVKLEGQVDEYGLARIEGTMNMLDPVQHTDITLEFRNLLMSSLSPYTVSFAGREISEGKLNLDLRYDIDAGQLKGENDVIISDLQLGEKIDHPDAGSLPLGLAVALLKDANGVIDINLPIEGNINDPEFRIGGIVWQALAGLVTRIVSAPFALLGKLIGIDSEDLGQFQFLAGRADLTPPEKEKINQLEEALQQRPELTVEISGVTDPAIDVPALKTIRLRDIIISQLGEASGVDNKETIMLDVEVRGLLELLFAERYPDIPLESLKAEHTAAPAGDPEGKPVLDGLAYSADLRDRLLVSETISKQDLTDLAQARAEVIKTAFLAGGQFDEARVVIAAPGETESEDGQWVTLELAVAPE